MRTASVMRRIKRAAELAYWIRHRLRERRLSNEHYEFLFTTHFGLDRDHYSGKTMLDVGCGPRGSLEWAGNAAERVGLDPLADKYRVLGGRSHAMRYVKGAAESIPFPDDHFDIVSSFNSLDHVDDLDPAVHEICRVVKPGGLFLLLTDVNHEPTITEPLTLRWDVVERFTPPLRVLEVRRFEKSGGMYESLASGTRYDDGDRRPRYGILSAMLSK